MKKTVTLALLFLVASCGVLKKTVKDPYVGSFNFTVFEVDNYGDIPVKLTINKVIFNNYRNIIHPSCV